jgi:VWFA-related protein
MALGFALLAAVALTTGEAAAKPALPADLPEVYRQWLEEIEPLISKSERETFFKLEKDYQRDAFIEKFWEVRDPYPDTARNEARDAWESRLAQAREEFPALTEERARMFLLNGPPAARIVAKCISLWPIEVWAYPPSERIPEQLILIFVQRFGQGKYSLWIPQEGLASLFQFAPPSVADNRLLQEIGNNCSQANGIAGAIAAVMRAQPMHYTLLVSRAQRPTEPPSREWVATFNSYSTDIAAGVPPLPAELGLAFPGRRQNRTIVQATLAVPASAVGTANLEGSRSYNFVLNGEVLLGRKLFDAFRYKFDLPASGVASASIPLVFERFLRPGSYKLIVKLEDLNGHGFYREERAIEVPQLGDQPVTATIDDETAKLLVEANAALSTLDNTIQIVRPRGDFQSGLVRFDTLITGNAITDVEFWLDGHSILRKNRPPFSVELDLGDVPRTRTLRAVAYDAQTREIASDEELLNASPHRFSVRLVEPRRGKRYSKSLRAEAKVELPEEGTLERVEFFLNETRVSTLYQEPWTQPILLPADGGIAYVRAVAYQTDGNSTEDLVFINAPDNLEELEIQFVELYTAVLDRQKRPVQGLERGDFKVTEDGVPQELTRFEKVENLPVHVAVLLDTSASMEPNLAAARDAALRFFQQVLQPKDRASLIPFNDRPTLAVKMTNRLDDLAAGLAGLKAERGTSLYDSVVFSLFYFNGIKGQRALLVLSDGKDENSKFGFDQTLDFARRAGVAIYTVGLGISRGEFETRRVLKTLAEETGGRSFFVSAATELDPIYADIQQELRSRYLLAYQSTNTDRSLRFRAVEVKLDKPGLDAKTMRGYYP